MTDNLELLRDIIAGCKGPQRGFIVGRETLQGFADEIRQLREDFVRLSAILGLDPDTWTGPPWRPIATAPRDGTWILVWDQTSKIIDVAQWVWPPGGDVNDGDWVEPESYTVDPSHWMPLPPPPQFQEAA